MTKTEIPKKGITDKLSNDAIQIYRNIFFFIQFIQFSI